MISEMPSHDTVYASLPVNFQTAWAALRNEIRKRKPAAVLMLGERREGQLTLETVAHNRRHTQQGIVQIEKGRMAALCSLFDTRQLQRKLHRGSARTSAVWAISDDAGSYLCNYSYYKMLRHLPNLPCLFVHVKALDSQKDVADLANYAKEILRLLDYMKSYLTERQPTKITQKLLTVPVEKAGRAKRKYGGLTMADKHLVACEQEHELITVLKHFKKGSSKENIDKMQNACRSWKKDAGVKYKPKNRDTFYKYLQEKGVLSKIR